MLHALSTHSSCSVHLHLWTPSASQPIHVPIGRVHENTISGKTDNLRVAMRSLIVMLAAGLAGSATEPSKIAVVPVDLGGEAEPALGDALLGALVKGASEDGTTVVSADRACSDAECFATVARETGATYVIAARVEAEINDYRVELVARDMAGAERHSLKFDCEICTHTDLEVKLAREAAALRKKLAAPSREDVRPATIVVTTAHGPARVLVDGETVGVTPYEGEVSPGEHTLTVEADGYAPEHLGFEARSGAQSSFAVALEPEGGGREVRPRRLQIAGYTSLGVGVGALVAGAILVGIDDRPVRGRCSGDSIDVNGQCEFLHDTLVVGAVLTSVGAAAIVTGIALAVIGRPGRTSKRRAAVTIGGIKF
jgi:hypothetical protein